jgi:hypothetical protein
VGLSSTKYARRRSCSSTNTGDTLESDDGHELIVQKSREGQNCLTSFLCFVIFTKSLSNLTIYRG